MMASEAQRLIGISLTKIAQSRTHRGGVSLHKNLLVATVLQKARYIFMEEAYNMVHYQQASPVTPVQQLMPHHLAQLQHQQQVMQQSHHQQLSQPQQEDDEDELVGLTVEEAGVDQTSLPEDQPPSSIQDFLQPGCVKCTSNQQQHQHDKENQPPNYHNEQLTYLDLDKTPSVLQERSSGGNLTTTTTTTTTSVCLKRRRAVSEWETEEAVQSILPKRRCMSIDTCTTDLDTNDDDSVFLDDATLLSETVSKELEETTSQTNSTSNNNHTNSNSMDSIDRITSLVSIFSFGMNPDNNSNNANGKLSTTSNRSVSTPDLCSSQAKEGDTIQQRPFLAMTV